MTAVAIALTAIVTLPMTVRAMPPPYEDEEEPTPAATTAPSVSPSSFAGLFGLQGLQKAAKTNDGKPGDAKVRAAAVLRAAELGGDDAWKIVEASASDAAGDDPDGSLLVRLAAARSLGNSPRKAQATTALRPLVTAPSAPPKPVPAPVPTWGGWGGWPPVVPQPPPKPQKRADPDLARLVRETAALSLAMLGDFDNLAQRARARDDPEAARAATAALIAIPPPSLSVLLPKSSSTLPAKELVELLAKLGDLRAADTLLGVSRGKDEGAAAIAMVALAKLGDGRVSTVARNVFGEEKPVTDAALKLRVGAAEALAELSEPTAETAILSLFDNKKSELEGKRLATKYPTAGLLKVLEPMAKEGDAAAIAALGRLGAPGVPALSAIARDDAEGKNGSADAAAYALAISPSSEAAGALEKLLEFSPSAIRKRRAVRAGAVRHARLGSSPGALRKEAGKLAQSTNDADRWVGTTLLSVADLSDAKEALSSKDAIRRRAAAVALAAHPSRAAGVVAREILSSTTSTEDPDVTRALAAVAARDVDGSVSRDVPVTTSTLAVWLAEDGPASPLAAFLLASRGGDVARPHVARALESDDLSVRAGALLGFGVSGEKSATGELAGRIPDLVLLPLRRAATRALAMRGDPAGQKALDFARKLDPDAVVRTLARSAVLKAGIAPLSPIAKGNEVVQAKVSKGSEALLATFVGVDGFGTPAFADPDGFILVFRVAPGAARLDVRPAPSAPVVAKPIALPPAPKPSASAPPAPSASASTKAP